MGHSFEIHYKTGATNRVAKALSREFADTMELSALVTVGGVQWAELQARIEHDPFIKQLTQSILAGEPHPNGYNCYPISRF